LQVVVLDDALREDLSLLWVGVGKDHATDVAVRVDPTGEIEPVFQRFPSGIIACKGVVVVFDRWV
jgi:hypothetical protein